MGNCQSSAREAPRRGPHTIAQDTADQRAVTTDSREPA